MPTDAAPSNEMLYENVKDRASVPLQDKPYMFNLRRYPLVSTTLFSAQFGKVDSYGGQVPPPAKIRPVENTVYPVYIQNNPKFMTKINHGGGYNSTATSLVVLDVLGIRPGNLLYIPATGERVYVVARTLATKTITVLRHIGAPTETTTIPEGATLLIMSSANSDGSDLGESVMYKGTKSENATQIMRAELEVGGSAEAERQQAGKPLAQQRILKAQEVVSQFERLLLFGRAPADFYITGTDGKPIYLTNGIDVKLTENTTDVGGAALTEGDLDDILNDIAEDLSFDEEPLWCYAGTNMMKAVTSFAKDKVQTNNLVTKYGGRVSSYLHQAGWVHFVNEPLFSAQYGLEGNAVFLRPKFIEINPKKGREFRMYPEVKSMKTDGVDKIVDAYMGEYGCFLHFPETQGKVVKIG